jgi:hypothetical protein
VSGVASDASFPGTRDCGAVRDRGCRRARRRAGGVR